MLPEVGNYLKRLKATHDEDTIDRMNYVYTPTILLIFSILLTAKQYVGEPLQCWVPHQFKDGWEKYVERHCFIENTYFAKIDEQFPDEEGKQKSIIKS
uniref:Innexin n=1 Tax=Syphacia muris TaxID=451379 RepID=A0A0N5ACX8_9BILA